MAELILKDESNKLIGTCMEVHRELEMGFKEGVYEDALEIEFHDCNMMHQRERLFKIPHKGRIRKHRYKADFIVFDQIVLKVKATSVTVNSFVAKIVNYLKASGLKPGIVPNLGDPSLIYKREVF